MNELFTIAYSPWSEKARWALDHHHVPYKERKFIPMLSQPGLRLRLRQLRGRVTAPMLFCDGQVLSDSFDIARHADRVGNGSKLFPEGAEDTVARWNDRSESLMSWGRALVMARVRSDPDAQREYVASSIPPALAGALRPLALVGTAYLARKYYQGQPGDEVEARARMRQELSDLATALGDRPHLVGEFSYADIVMACALQQVEPVHDRFVHLSDGMRRCVRDGELATEFAPLLAWRDHLYEHHR